MQTRQRQRGANLAEFALVMVALFTLIFAIADFARAYNVYQVLVNAAREGARYAVAPEPQSSDLPTTAEIEARVQSFLDSGLVKQATISVDPMVTKTLTNIDTTFTRVTVSAPYDFIMLPFADVTITAQSEMRNETN